MPGYGSQVVTINKKVHLLAEGGRTECGVSIPSDAGWTYANRGDADVSKVCPACEKRADDATEEEPEPTPPEPKATKVQLEGRDLAKAKAPAADKPKTTKVPEPAAKVSEDTAKTSGW